MGIFERIFGDMPQSEKGARLADIEHRNNPFRLDPVEAVVEKPSKPRRQATVQPEELQTSLPAAPDIAGVKSILANLLDFRTPQPEEPEGNPWWVTKEAEAITARTQADVDKLTDEQRGAYGIYQHGVATDRYNKRRK